MSGRDIEQVVVEAAPPTDLAQMAQGHINSALVGRIVGFLQARTPLVTFPGQPDSAAVAARAIVDLHAEHIGCDVVLMFDGGDPLAPIVMGCIRTESAWPLAERPGQVEVDADGERLIVSAKEQIVLRCGKASITLTKRARC